MNLLVSMYELFQHCNKLTHSRARLKADVAGTLLSGRAENRKSQMKSFFVVQSHGAFGVGE
jgi:hypothetical protein